MISGAERGGMKRAAPEHDRSARSSRPARADSPAGESTVTLRPPAYGIEFVDEFMDDDRRSVAGPIQAAQSQRIPEGPARLPAPTGGAEMPGEVRAKMEAAFGVDFSPVRIHEGPHAPAIGALAYTQGTNIHFAPGQYQPGSGRGQALLGHELTHVVQQSQGRVRATAQAKGVDINDDASLEQEADEMGEWVAREGAEDEDAAPGPIWMPPDGSVAQRAVGVSQALAALEQAPRREPPAPGGRERGVVQLQGRGRSTTRKKGTRKKPQPPAAKTPSPEQVLTFDGRRLVLEEGGKQVLIVPATSGLKKNNKKLQVLKKAGRVSHIKDYTDPEYQEFKDIGPIPQGTYELALEPGVPREKSGGGWGIAAWRLRPESLSGRVMEDVSLMKDKPAAQKVPGLSTVLGALSDVRSGFFLHQDGGADGTAGCVGIQGADNTRQIWERLKRYQRGGHDKIKLVVTYGKPPLRASVSPATRYWVRGAPGVDNAKVGRLALREMGVEVLEASKIEGKIWYKVRFKEKDFEAVVQELGKAEKPDDPKFSADMLQKHGDRTGWIQEDATSRVVIKWGDFLAQIDAFDKQYAGEHLRDRLTRLRQIGEDSGLGGNAVVGRGGLLHKGGDFLYDDRSDRKLDPSRWQLLLEAKAVEMPNGAVIDIHHFILGLDALALPAEARSDNRTLFGALNVGESVSAATWSGDVGAAVADYVAHKSAEWESANTSADGPERLRFYFETRAPVADLLGDLDAWGAQGLVPRDDQSAVEGIRSIRDILVRFYGGEGQSAGTYKKQVKPGRAQGIKAFLLHYGFTSTTGLSSQPAAQKVNAQVEIFSEAWYRQVHSEWYRKAHSKLLGSDVSSRLKQTSKDMTVMFLAWLEGQARQYRVSLSP
jgi:hypothetical protein